MSSYNAAAQTSKVLLFLPKQDHCLVKDFQTLAEIRSNRAPLSWCWGCLAAVNHAAIAAFVSTQVRNCVFVPEKFRQIENCCKSQDCAWQLLSTLGLL